VLGPERIRRRSALLALLALLLGASLSPRSAPACEDQGRRCCDYCRMILEDERFGGDLATATSGMLIFDSTECMAAFWITQRGDTTRIRSMRSVDHDRPARPLDARRAWYLRSDSLSSPMGVNLSAYGSAAAARAARRIHGGEILKWNQVVAFILHRWYRDRRP